MLARIADLRLAPLCPCALMTLCTYVLVPLCPCALMSVPLCLVAFCLRPYVVDGVEGTEPRKFYAGIHRTLRWKLKYSQIQGCRNVRNARGAAFSKGTFNTVRTVITTNIIDIQSNN